MVEFIAISSAVASTVAAVMNRDTIGTSVSYAFAACVIQIALVWIMLAYGYLIGEPNLPYEPILDLEQLTYLRSVVSAV